MLVERVLDFIEGDPMEKLFLRCCVFSVGLVMPCMVVENLVAHSVLEAVPGRALLVLEANVLRGLMGVLCPSLAVMSS